MPQNITLDEVDALDDVNGSSPYLNDVTERIDIAYDDGGDRLWYSYNKLSDGSGMTRVTLPGVGVYEATKTNGVNGTFKLVRKDLVAGGYRDEAGHAHFPVMDAQGNVRGYATSDGIQSAYDYFAYGTVMDLSTDAGDDNKRWQDKEFDGEHGKYYFGARYFDPFFGMWMSPDPAGQFANPYTYGGDPVNFVDPNGEFAFIPVLVGSIVGAVIGGSSALYSCTKSKGSGNWGDCLGDFGKGAGVGAVSGFFGGLAGGATAGLGSAVSGSIGSMAGNSAGYLMDIAVNDRSFSPLDFGGGALKGAVSGLAGGYASGQMGMNGWNILGNTGSEIVGSSIAGGVGDAMGGGDFWEGFKSGALLGTSSALLTSFLHLPQSNSNGGKYDGAVPESGMIPEDGSPTLLQDGDIVVMEKDGSISSSLIAWITGEDFTHAAYVEKNPKNKNELVFREATNVGKEYHTPFKAYKGRRFKILGNSPAKPYAESMTGLGPGGYTLVPTNCTTQVTDWTGIRRTNLPGTLARYMGGADVRYHNSFSLQRFAW